MEYLSTIEEFRDVLFNVYNRMKAGAVFLFCFSHQLQHHGHRSLFNASATVCDAPGATFIYSFRDVITVAADVGFVVERVVEQQTTNPSQISYESSQKYPYHYRRGKNPCRPEYDHVSNEAPHTVIYKCRKPREAKKQAVQQTFDFAVKAVRLWGEDRQVDNEIAFGVNGQHYEVLEFARKDSLVAMLKVADFEVWSGDIADREPAVIHAVGSEQAEVRVVTPGSLLALVHKRLSGVGLSLTYRRAKVDIDAHRTVWGTFVERIDPLHSVMRSLYPRQSHGILVFLNGDEPGAGKVSLESVFPTLDDHVEVFYMATGWLAVDEPKGTLFD